MPRVKRPDDLAREAAGAPPEPELTSGECMGTVKWWRDEKGYGLIASAATAPWDIWCHFGAIEAEGYRRLSRGESVHVEYLRMDRLSFRYVARRVRRVEAEAG